MRKRRAKDVERGDWAEFVRRIERDTGLTSGTLGPMCGTIKETWWRWKTGKQRPIDPDRLAMVAAAFEIPLDKVMWAAGLVPTATPEPPPLSRIELRLRGLHLSSDDKFVIHILGLPVDQDMKIFMLEEYRAKLDNFIKSEIRWADMVSGSFPILTEVAA